MILDPTPFAVVLVSAAIGSSALAVYAGQAWQAGRSRMVGAFAVLSVAVTIWAALYAVQLASVDLGTKYAAYVLLHVGGAMVPPAWFAFALGYTDRSELVTARTMVGVSVLPVAFLGALVLNPGDFVVTEVALDTSGAHPILETGTGPGYVIFLAYSYILLTVGGLFILHYASTRTGPVRRQSLLIGLGVAVPFLVNVWDVLELPPAPSVGANLTPVALSASVVLFGLAIFRYRLFDLAPIARTTVVETMNDGVVVVNGSGTIVDCNPAARRLLTIDGELIGTTAETALPAPLDADEGDGPAVREAADGERLFTVSQTPLHGEEVHGSVLLLHDVTTLEHQRRELTRKNERLEAFASTISHDLRNPLSVLAGYTEMARESGDPAHFDVIDETIESMDIFLEDLLVLARQGETIDETEPVSLAAVAEDASSDIADSGIDLEIVDDVTIDADRDRLRQALSNLFRNAVDHGSDEGRIRLEPTVEGFAVEDSGPGIPPSERESVFEPGHTTSESGTGFGLAIVGDIVAAHGWDIAISTGELGGARFDIALDGTE